MSTYLERLKKVENGKIFNNSPVQGVSKVSEGAFGTFDTYHSEENGKIFNNSSKESIEIKLIRGWLFKICEPVEDHFIVLDKCKADPEAMEYFLKHARGEFNE